MKCFHISRYRHWHGYVGESSYHETCMTCGELLPLGSAKLDGVHAEAVAIELRAACLAVAPYMHVSERSGWACWKHDLDRSALSGIDAWLAGWLGREIFEARSSP